MPGQEKPAPAYFGLYKIHIQSYRQEERPDTLRHPGDYEKNIYLSFFCLKRI